MLWRVLSCFIKKGYQTAPSPHQLLPESLLWLIQLICFLLRIWLHRGQPRFRVNRGQPDIFTRFPFLESYTCKFPLTWAVRREPRPPSLCRLALSDTTTSHEPHSLQAFGPATEK